MRLDMTRGAARATLFLFVFTLVLFAANLIFTAHQINSVRASEAASRRATASTLQLCELGNEARAQQLGLWKHLIVISKPPAHESVQARNQRIRTTKAFLNYVHRIFAPRDCRRITR